MKEEKNKSALYNYLHKDLKEFNKYVLSLVCVGILVGAGLLSYFITTSFAFFTDTIMGEKTIEATVGLKNLDTSGANEPVLDEGMIPVYYDETSETWRKASSSNSNEKYRWYDYDNKMWANSVTVSSTNRAKYLSAENGTEIPMDDILTMQVWIPRYKYKVWNYNADGTKTSEPQQIEVTWENGTAKTGEISCTDSISGTDGDPSEICKLKETNATCTDSTCNNKTYTHPAFTFGDEEIQGFWIGKFELTGTIDNITTKPDLTSLTNQSVSSFATNIMNMKNSGNSYGFATTSDTHMIKNMEWGAVAYLSHSKYGTCTDGTCKEVNVNNSSSNYTGRSGGSSSASSASDGTYKYNQIKSSDGTLIGEGKDGPSSSTTHNIYGVYDMSGGSNEYVMGNIVSSDGTTMIPGVSGYTTSTYPNSKYYDIYSFSTDYKSRIRSKLGDGIKEVYSDSSTTTTGWYKDFSYLAGSDGPWFNRGGNYGNALSSAGVFNSSNLNGDANSRNSSRLVITP